MGELQKKMAAVLLQQMSEKKACPLFKHTKKARITPAGRTILAIRASAHRTGGSGFGSWATPSVRDEKDTGNLETSMVRQDGRMRNDSVPRQAQLASWPTPQAMDTLPPREPETFNEWNNSRDGRKNRQFVSNLRQAVVQFTAPGPTPNGSHAETEKQGRLNPAFPRWLMGYPPEWDDCAATATPLSHK